MFDGDGSPHESRTATAQVVTAQRIARLFVLGFGLCEECTLPLSDRQKIALLTAGLLEFDGLQAEVRSLLQVERLLADLDDPEGVS